MCTPAKSKAFLHPSAWYACLLTFSMHHNRTPSSRTEYLVGVNYFQILHKIQSWHISEPCIFRWLPSKTSERSRVGQKLSDLTTQKVIVGILAILLIIPVFNVYSGLYGNYSGLTQGGLNMLHDQYLVVSQILHPRVVYHQDRSQARRTALSPG